MPQKPFILVSCSQDCSIRLWNCFSRTQIAVIMQSIQPIGAFVSLDWSKVEEGRLVATTSTCLTKVMELAELINETE